MQYVNLFLGRPGLYLCMMFLWVVPFMIGDIRYFKQNHIAIDMGKMDIYIIPFFLCIAAAWIINYFELSYGVWTKRNRWLRYIILTGSYFLVACLSSTLTFIFHEFGYVDFAGDVCGTVVMGYLPTAILYGVLGFFFTLFFSAKQKRQ